MIEAVLNIVFSKLLSCFNFSKAISMRVYKFVIKTNYSLSNCQADVIYCYSVLPVSSHSNMLFN